MRQQITSKLGNLAEICSAVVQQFKNKSKVSQGNTASSLQEGPLLTFSPLWMADDRFWFMAASL